MKSKRSSVMIGRLLIFAAFGVGVVLSAPTSRPLEHSPSDLAWDAWLQQGSRQAAPPRRITTKSLFVLPHLGPESLPACAEGYRPDSMGRCVKVVKVDENAHLEFLLQKLNSQFATETSEGQDESYDYDIDTESTDASGPFQFSIPLALQSSGSKHDTDTSGEIMIFKKQNPSTKLPESEKKPTSSPEVVPEYNDKKQFFLDSTPAAAESILQPNNSVPAGSVSILLRNSTNTGITLLAPTNGKFENVTSDKDYEASDLIKELEKIKVGSGQDIKTDLKSGKKDSIQSSTLTPAVEFPPSETTIVDSSFSNNNNHQGLNSPILIEADESTTVLKKTELHKNALSNISNKISVNNLTAVKNNSDTNSLFVNQIEGLKAVLTVESDKHNDATMDTPTSKLTGLLDTNVSADLNKEDDKLVDMEEKIKIISRLADVSRNTEGPFSTNSVNIHKKTSDYVRFPSSTDSDTASSSSFYQYPPNFVKVPPPRNLFMGGNVGPALPNHGSSQPLSQFNNDRNFQDPNIRNPPYWLPYGWNVHNPSGEHNLMDLWSRMSSMQRYPYDVRFEQDRHRPHQQILYPSSRESGGRLNVRHTPVNYRQGRDDVFGGRQVYQDESMNYKRSRHPHFRESEELSRILEAFNGR